MSLLFIKKLFYIDQLSIIILILACYIGTVVAVFSKNYIKGDARYLKFFSTLLILVLSVMTMAIADNLVLFLIAWVISSSALIKLMVHKSAWKAAKESGKICTRYFLFGLSFISMGFGLLYFQTGKLSIQKIIQLSSFSTPLTIPLLLLLIGALIQTAIWPFHRWLISSLNSPTPVSAMMHAGIINGGGFLLARFAPLYFAAPNILTLIFALGLISSLIGSLWKLMQSDIKKMLACSTMSQMGFMLMQCGLGLFTAAIAHLCWHGMYKAYLFLGSGGSAQEKKISLENKPTYTSFLCALFCGFAGAYSFSLASHTPWFANNTTSLLLVIALIGGSQVSLSILQNKPLKKLFIALTLTTLTGFIYGKGIFFLELFLKPLGLMHPQKLNFLHYFAFLVLILGWLLILFIRHPSQKGALPNWILYFYVKALNKSQSHPKTITANRKDYKYV